MNNSQHALPIGIVATGKANPIYPFELFRCSYYCAEVNWEPMVGKHDNFNWDNYAKAMTRLEERLTRGDTIVSIVVSTKGENLE